MKITLTYAEVSDIVREKYGLHQGVEIEIEPAPVVETESSFATFLSSKLKNAGLLSLGGEVLYNQKIAAIKMIRDNWPTIEKPSLAASKSAAENFPAFLEYLRTHELPVMDADSPRPWI